MSAKVQYITDSEGNKTGVVLSLEEFENLVEDTHLSHVYRETKDEPRRPFNEFVDELRAAGEIDVEGCNHFAGGTRNETPAPRP